MKNLIFIIGMFISVAVFAQVETIPTITGANPGDGEIKLIVAAAQRNDDYLEGLTTINTNQLWDSLKLVNVLGYGAIPNDGIDDAAAINAASIVAYTFNRKLYLPAGDTFDIESSLVFRSHVIGTGAVIQTADTTYAAIVWGDSTGLTAASKTVFLPDIYCSNHANGRWSIQTEHIGLKILNANKVKFYVGKIRYFRYGIKLLGYNSYGSQYNDFYSPDVEANFWSVYISPGAYGNWTNQNNFFGGSLGSFSNDGTDVIIGTDTSAHVFIDTSTYSVPNMNVFWGTSLEGNMHFWKVDLTGSNNAFRNCRWEGNNPRVKQYKNGATAPANNHYSGYSAWDIEFYQDDRTVGYITDWEYTGGIHRAGGEFGPFVGSNLSSDNNGVFYALRAADSLDADINVKYTLRAGANRTEMKYFGYTDPLIRFQHNAGTMSFGDGSGEPDTKISRAGAYAILIDSTLVIGPSQTGDEIEGGIMYDEDDNHFYGWNGSGWVQLDN